VLSEQHHLIDDEAGHLQHGQGQRRPDDADADIARSHGRMGLPDKPQEGRDVAQGRYPLFQAGPGFISRGTVFIKPEDLGPE
jgi:hypothetical protein